MLVLSRCICEQLNYVCIHMEALSTYIQQRKKERKKCPIFTIGNHINKSMHYIRCMQITNKILPIYCDTIDMRKHSFIGEVHNGQGHTS